MALHHGMALLLCATALIVLAGPDGTAAQQNLGMVEQFEHQSDGSLAEPEVRLRGPRDDASARSTGGQGREHGTGEQHGRENGTGGDASQASSALPQNLSSAEGIAMARQYQGHIPGSRLSTPEEVAAVRESLACLATRGKWVFNATPRRLPWPQRTAHNSIRSCDDRWVKTRGGVAGRRADSIKEPAQWNVRPGLKYEWQPETECGEWPRFDADAFCSVLRRLGGPLLLVGDSTTREMQDSLHNLLQLNEEETKDLFTIPEPCKTWLANETDWLPLHTCLSVPRCGERIPILRVRNDHLSLVEQPPTRFGEPNGHGGKKYTGFDMPWLDLIKAWGVKAIVLNRGLHYSPKSTVQLELEEALVTIRKRHPDMLIMYRSSVPGHADCTGTGAETPLSLPQTKADLPYHWGDMHEQNVVARTIVESLGGLYLDVEPMHELRADGHFVLSKGKDCLHHCSPGPVDEWSRFLQVALWKLVPEQASEGVVAS